MTWSRDEHGHRVWRDARPPVEHPRHRTCRNYPSFVTALVVIAALLAAGFWALFLSQGWALFVGIVAVPGLVIFTYGAVESWGKVPRDERGIRVRTSR